jgi:hypothetical protein
MKQKNKIEEIYIYPYKQFSSKLLTGSTPLKVSVLARLHHPARKVQTHKKEIETKLKSSFRRQNEQLLLD